MIILQPSFRIAAKRRVRNPYSWTVVMDSGLLASLGPGMTNQIPANQLKPCLLQNVSVKLLVTSIALIHFAFL